MRKQFAVFDIDGTIARSSLLQQMVRILVNRGRLDIGPAQEIEVLLHDVRQRTSDADFGTIIKRAVNLLFGSLKKPLTVEEYDEIIDAVVKTSLSHTYVYTRELIQTLKRNNYFLISISGSELRAVSTFSRALGFDAWVGQVQYLHDGKTLTGDIKALGQPKDTILATIIDKFNLDPKGSMAIGDSSTDIPLLSKVENPVCFNPNQHLFTYAQQQGWMVVIERKDMVYGMVKEGNNYVLRQTNTG